jgi:putative sugar O-methyltransferase
MKKKLSNEFTTRYKAFLKSDVFENINDYSQSDYWKYHSSRVKIQIANNDVSATAESGFYTLSSNKYRELLKKTYTAIKSPHKLFSWLRAKVGLSINGIKLLKLGAFDKVMDRHSITDPDLSPFRINFDNVKSRNNIISTVKKCKKNYSIITKGEAGFSGHVLISYYHLNILYSYVDLNNWKDKKIVLEIGAGNGNLMSIVKGHSPDCTIIDVDLPETISHAVIYIVSIFPSAKILMPNEVESLEHEVDFYEYDFVFLTPIQAYLINDNLVDLCINIDSFQEMKQEQISEYFDLIQRVGKNNSYFLTSNRVEKIPCGPGSYEKETPVFPNRFSEYPWYSSNETIIYEICRMVRLTQLDSNFIRLEKIKKP